MPEAAHSEYIRYHQKSAYIRRWMVIAAVLYVVFGMGRRKKKP